MRYKTIKLLVGLALLLVPPILSGATESAGMYNVFSFGAKGDGVTMDTKAIQSAIDQCHQKGGGKVYFQNGEFITGTLYLKTNVSLYLEAGAVLRASNNLDDFPVTPSKYPSYTGTYVTNKMVIYAEDAKNITICGRGTIDGNGDHWVDGPYGSPSFSIRPRIIHFRNCENILIRDVTLYNSASWVQSYQSCKNMVIDGITVDSRENKLIDKERYVTVRGRNTDGLDLVDCEKVRISNCNINSGDDAICLKSFSPNEGCRDIVISNCVVSSNASGIKIGTETCGAFEDITIQNCVVYDTRAEGIALLTADGSTLERIFVSNISIRNVKGTAIAIRLGNRNRTHRENAVVNTPKIKDIIIENIQGTRISSEFSCSVTAIPGYMIENVVLRNINLQFVGGGKTDDSYRKIPENEKAYPSGRLFGVLPAYGFFIRHAKNIVMDNIRLSFENDEGRPAILCDDVESLEIKGLKAQGSEQMPELVRLVNTRDVVIADSKPSTVVPVFLTVKGDKTSSIILQNNQLKNARQNFAFENESLKKELKETSTYE